MGQGLGGFWSTWDWKLIKIPLIVCMKILIKHMLKNINVNLFVALLKLIKITNQLCIWKFVLQGIVHILKWRT